MLFLQRAYGGFAGVADRVHALFPVADLLLGLLPRDAVRLLDPAQQQVALSRDHVELVIGELAPLLQRVALELLPVAFDAVPVHFCFLVVMASRLGPDSYPVCLPARTTGARLSEVSSATIINRLAYASSRRC